MVVGLALVVFAVAGVAVDGTRAFLFRRTLQTVADSSAVAAAGEISRSRYYASRGRDLLLDPVKAEETARQWLRRRGIPLTVTVQTNENEVRVTARGSVTPSFLSLVGVHSIPVVVQSSARPVGGTAP